MKLEYPNSTILIVDDEPELLSILAENAAVIYGNVLIANGGYEALEIIRQQPVEVVTLDILMPEISGLVCLRKILEIQPDIVSIFITGHSKEKYVREALNLGAVDFLDRPFKYEDLTAALYRSAILSEMRLDRKKILEALLYEYIDMEKGAFDALSDQEKTKYLKLVREILEVKLLRKQNINSLIESFPAKRKVQNRM